LQFVKLGNFFQGFLFGLVFLGIFFVIPAFGHGIGGETLKPVNIGNRNATIFISIEPPIFDQTEKEQRVLVRFFDADTDQTIENVTYKIKVSKGGEIMFQNKFFDDIGYLVLKIIPNDNEQVTVTGAKEPILEGWMRDGTTPITIEGSIFNSGGLYSFDIEILTVDSVTNVLEKPVIYKGAVSVADKISHDVKDGAGNEYKLGMTSYYDQINDLDYSKDQRKVSFAIPFDWSIENIEQVNIVHEELHIPKTFGDLLVTKYNVTVNDIPLPENSVLADDYSEEDRIVHMIIPNQLLFSMREVASKISSSEMLFSITPSQDVVLPLSAHTTSVQYQVDLWWEPFTIKSGQQTKFFVDVSELYVSTKEQKPITFDLVLIQHNKEIFRKTIDSNVNAPPKSFFQEYTFTSEQIGPVIVSIENINNKFLASADFIVVVEPEEIPTQTFPFRMSSIKPTDDGFTEGKFYVIISWIPSPLEINEESQFIITIYDKKTNMPVSQAEYDFILMTEGYQEFYRTSGFATTGGSFENYRFADKDIGNVILRIENIDQSQEFVEIPIIVTPEFPLGSLLILPLTFLIFIIISSKFKNLIVQPIRQFHT
jgi:hypothetical protein